MSWILPLPLLLFAGVVVLWPRPLSCAAHLTPPPAGRGLRHHAGGHRDCPVGRFPGNARPQATTLLSVRDGWGGPTAARIASGVW